MSLGTLLMYPVDLHGEFDSTRLRVVHVAEEQRALKRDQTLGKFQVRTSLVSPIASMDRKLQRSKGPLMTREWFARTRYVEEPLAAVASPMPYTRPKFHQVK
jgi:hypothetical protein